jgi:GT2 family glycosyltransferase
LTLLADWLGAHPDGLAGPRCVDAASGRTVATGFVGRRVITPTGDATIPVDGLSGFCLALGPQAWRALGLPDAEAFPHYAGDTAYTLRARHRGHPVVLLPPATVTLTDHEPAHSTIAGRIDRRATLSANWTALFRATRSPFRLATARALLRVKYGPVLGSLLGTVRTIAWNARFAWAWLARGRR